MKSEIINGVEFTHAKHDINGNERYIVHFLKFVTDEEREMLDVFGLYPLAAGRALKYATVYRGKDYGGGFVLYSNNLNMTAALIGELRDAYPMLNLTGSPKGQRLHTAIYHDILDRLADFTPQELGEELLRYKRDYPKELDYNYYQHGNLLVAPHDIVCLLRDCGYKYLSEANWERQAARAEKQYKQATRDVIDFITNHLWNR